MLRKYKILFFLALIFISACSDLKSDHEIRDWFAKNFEQVDSINAKLVNNRTFLIIDPSQSIKFVPKYHEFTKEELSTYKSLVIKIESLGIKNISINREHRRPQGKLLTVTYIIDTKGFLSTSEVIGVEYIADQDILNVFKKNTRLNVYELPKPNWFIVKSS